jgi:hypothetical protein
MSSVLNAEARGDSLLKGCWPLKTSDLFKRYVKHWNICTVVLH